MFVNQRERLNGNALYSSDMDKYTATAGVCFNRKTGVISVDYERDDEDYIEFLFTKGDTKIQKLIW